MKLIAKKVYKFGWVVLVSFQDTFGAIVDPQIDEVLKLSAGQIQCSTYLVRIVLAYGPVVILEAAYQCRWDLGSIREFLHRKISSRS